MVGLIQELWVLGRAFQRRDYPPFVYDNGEYGHFLPSFYYHDVLPAEFERDLAYLQENGYRTLNCDEACDRLTGHVLAGSREVLLTFDDGLLSIHTVVYPLLRKYGMKAVSYLTPAWIEKPRFLNWEQCREMLRTGHIDFQSHSFGHSKVMTRLDVIGVWTKTPENVPWGLPGLQIHKVDFDVPRWPLFAGDSLFSGKPAYTIGDEFWQACAQLSKNTSRGAAIKRDFQSALDRHRSSVTVKNEKELLALMTEDAALSRAVMQKEMPGHRVNHFAFPWHVNSPLAWEALRTTGFRSAAVGIKGTDCDGGWSDKLTKIYRVSSDFLRCLPGKDRKTFSEVVGNKVTRRFRRESVYGIAH